MLGAHFRAAYHMTRIKHGLTATALDRALGIDKKQRARFSGDGNFTIDNYDVAIRRLKEVYENGLETPAPSADTEIAA